MKKYDCIVIGLGAMGSSTLYHLAKQGSNVLGIEQFKVSHNYGSSHGLSRIIRLAYFENASYVAMLRRSYKLWNELENEYGPKLLTKTGSLDIGIETSKNFQGSKYACEKEKLEHEILNQDQLGDRFPGWQMIPKNAKLKAVYQPDGGILNPERCTSAHVTLAKKRYGAHVREEETVTEIEIINNKNEVLVKTNKDEYLTSKIILSSGPWLGGFIKKSSSLSKIKSLQTISNLLQPQRNVVIWYKSKRPDLYQIDNFPVFYLNYNEIYYYGFPISDEGFTDFEKHGFKIGRYHHRRENLSYEMLNKEAEWRMKFDRSDEDVIGIAVKDLLSPAYGSVLKQMACIFTNTPDEHFIIDSCPDPNYPCIALISACSGHGFKFSSIVGEIMATLVRSNNQQNPSTEYKHAKIDWLKANRLLH